jgi:hypothetical protein
MAKKKVEEKVEVKAEVTEAKPVEKEAKETEVIAQSAAKPHHQHRLQALNEIAQSNREERDAALAEDETTVEEDLAEASKAAAEEEPEVETKPEAEPVKRKFVVNGKEVLLTEDEIVERVQKSELVDVKLREANQLLEDARKRSLPTQERPSPLPVPPDAGNDELVSKLTAAIVRGSEEEISQALKETMGGRLAALQGLDPKQVHGQVEEAIAFNQAKALLDEPPERGGFSDILSDPMLKSQFERRENELRDAGDKRPYRELYTAIGTEIRNWRNDFIAKHTPKSGLEDRDALKRQTGVVRGAGAKLPVPPEARPKTHDEKLEGMRRARGLN